MLNPRIWLLAAGILLMAAFCLKYYQDQLDATRTLAMKFGLPDLVAVEDFDAERHSNNLAEVRFIAQTRENDIRLIDVHAAPPFYLIPLYATTADLGGALPAEPVAYYLSRRDPGVSGLDGFGLTEVERRAGGTLVELTGTRMMGQAALDNTAYRQIGQGLSLGSGSILVAAELVERKAVLGYRDIAPLRATFLILAVLLLAVAGASAVFGRREIAIGRPAEREVKMPETQRGSRAFQPLASQDELRRSEEAERARRRRSRLSFAAGFADPMRAVKNPR